MKGWLRNKFLRATGAQFVQIGALNLYMAHHCGFMQKVLTGTLQASSFVAVAAKRRGHPYYDLWALGTVAPMGEAELRELAAGHFPG